MPNKKCQQKCSYLFFIFRNEFVAKITKNKDARDTEAVSELQIPSNQRSRRIARLETGGTYAAGNRGRYPVPDRARSGLKCIFI